MEHLEEDGGLDDEHAAVPPVVAGGEVRGGGARVTQRDDRERRLADAAGAEYRDARERVWSRS